MPIFDWPSAVLRYKSRPVICSVPWTENVVLQDLETWPFLELAPRALACAGRSHKGSLGQLRRNLTRSWSTVAVQCGEERLPHLGWCHVKTVNGRPAGPVTQHCDEKDVCPPITDREQPGAPLPPHSCQEVYFKAWPQALPGGPFDFPTPGPLTCK